MCLLIFGWTSQTRSIPLQGSLTFVRGFLWHPWVLVRIRVLQLLLSRLSRLGTSSTLARSVLVPIFDSFFFSLCIFYILAALHVIWERSPPTRDQSHAPCIGRQSLNHWTSREVPLSSLSLCLLFFSHSILSLCDPRDYSMPGLHVHHRLPEFAQTRVHRVGDAIQPSHPLSSPSPPAFNLSLQQGLFQ